ncbi:hypothetical protein CLV24_11887 [Pontibacter ummariensis]|uniref:Uncharacterized protein n=1 Tax=Pontibacter ummariensis TaxID=1610492 RepID=A0A239ILH5_9BACT|nr:hypothetical protein [Pontibacter ummariensis]PRY09748.1 hypothetical protein CLV24_11887 [Pontibacter ummariensis]SNS94447.1 hypothetical protein SAMN06296052_1181 [Pontibacter ummariensis]
MDRDYRDRYNRSSSDYNREFDQKLHGGYNRDHGSGFRGEDEGPYNQNKGRSRSQSYRSRDYDMERDYYENTRRDRHELGDIRQAHGYMSFSDNNLSSSGGNEDLEDMQRERRARYEQGYGSGRLGGYSGSAFGGANYSAHGDFGGSPDYGSMSGSGGNADDYASPSNYSSGHGNTYSHPDRGVPNFSSRSWGDQYGDGGLGQGSRRGDAYGNGRYGRDRDYENSGNKNSSRGNYGSAYSSDRSYVGDNNRNSNSGYYNRNTRYSSNSDRGGYINHDMNNS